MPPKNNNQALANLLNPPTSLTKQEIDRRKRMYFSTQKPGPGPAKKEIDFFKSLVTESYIQDIFTKFNDLRTVTDQTPTFKIQPIFDAALVQRTIAASQKLFQTLLNIEQLTVPGMSFTEFNDLKSAPNTQQQQNNDSKQSKQQNTGSITYLKPNANPPITTNKKLILLGDTHGTFETLTTVFTAHPLNFTTVYVFNGDYVDRGSFSLEIVVFLLQLKLAGYQIHLIRGNHEVVSVCENYSLQLEVEKKYPNSTIFGEMCEFFKFLPLGVVINGKWLVIHGGLSSWADFDISVIQRLNRVRNPESDVKQLISCFDPLNDVLWADPTDEIDEFRFNEVRGASIQYGAGYCKKFLKRSKLTHMVRSHTCVENGYERHFDDCCFTLFSVPNYNGNNLGAYCVMFGLFDGEVVANDIIKGIYGAEAGAEECYRQDPGEPEVYFKQFTGSDNSRIVNQPLIQEMSNNMMQKQIMQMMMMYGGGQ